MLNSAFIDLIKQSKYLVILTGAGISTESGLADFRGPNGVWTRRDKGLKPLPGPAIQSVFPNKGHIAIKKLFDLGILKFLISQNVDNLHAFLAELHRNYHLYKCVDCDKRFSAEEIGWNKDLHGPGYRKDAPKPNQPTCPDCQGRIISSIVNFGDPMPEEELRNAHFHALNCWFIISGSASSFITNGMFE